MVVDLVLLHKQLLLMVVLLVFWLVTLVLVTPLNLPFLLLVVVDLVLLLLHRFVVLSLVST